MPRLHDKPELRATRRALRSHPTNAEAALWKGLRRRQLQGRRFRRQHSVGSYVVDFYCPEERLVIEVDGGIHRDPARADYDSRRQRWLEGQGLRVIRFSNETVFGQFDVVLSAIAASFATGKESDASLPPRSGGRAGEGGGPNDDARRGAPLPPAPSPLRREGENGTRTPP